MSWECACGSVGTRLHWCAYMQAIHAARVEALLSLIAAAALGDDEDADDEVERALSIHPYPEGLEP